MSDKECGKTNSKLQRGCIYFELIIFNFVIEVL